jgi:hypothetical protein
MNDTPERPAGPRPHAREYEDPHFHDEEIDPTQNDDKPVHGPRHHLPHKPGRKIPPPRRRYEDY